jgi:hypothetical protein
MLQEFGVLKRVFDCNSVRALRCFLGVHKYAAKVAVNGDAGWDPCVVKQRCEMVRLWNCLVSLPEERLTRNIFNWDRAKHHPWSGEVSIILSVSDLHLMYHNNRQCNIKVVRQRLLSKYEDQWKQDIWKKPKLRNYVQFKNDYVTEPYIFLNLKRRQRSLCAQLRTSTLPLAVEVGRFKGTPEHLRLCEFCDLQVVEDECHLVFYCPLLRC